MNLSHKTINAAGWQFVSIAGQAILQIIVLAVLSRNLSPEDFGIVAIANIFIMLATVLTLGSIRPAIIQKMEIDNAYIRVSFTISVGLGCVFTLAILGASDFVSRYFGNPQIAGVLALISVSFLLNSLGLVSEALLEKSLQFRKTSIANLTSYFFGYSLCAVILSINDYGVWSLAIAVVMQALLKNIIIYYYARHSLVPLLSLQKVKQIVWFSMGSMSKWIFNYTALQADNFIVGKILGPQSLGFYSMAFTAMDLPRRFLANIVERALLPSFSIMQDQDERFKKASSRAFELLNVVMMPISIYLIVMARDIVLLILGANWEPVVLPLQIMLLQIPLRTAIRISDVLTTARGVLYRNALRKIFYAVAVILFALVGSQWGLEGVATGVTIAVVVHFLLIVGLGLRTLGVEWGDLIKALLPGIALAGMIFVLIVPLSMLIDSRVISIVVTFVGSSGIVLLCVTFFPRVLGEGFIWSLRTVLGRLHPNTRIYNYLQLSIKRYDSSISSI